MTTTLPEYALHEIFLAKSVVSLVISEVKNASGSIKLMKPGPAIWVLTPASSGSFCGAVLENSVVKISAISRGFLCRVPASCMATLVE